MRNKQYNIYFAARSRKSADPPKQTKPYINLRSQPTEVTSELRTAILNDPTKAQFDFKVYLPNEPRYLLILNDGYPPRNMNPAPDGHAPNVHFHFVQENKSGHCFLVLAYATRDITAYFFATKFN